jgi:hypothetical protein
MILSYNITTTGIVGPVNIFFYHESFFSVFTASLEGQTIQRPKEKGQKDKQGSTKLQNTTQKTNDRTIQTQV